MLGLTSLPVLSYPQTQRCLGVNIGHGDTGLQGTKGSRGRWMNGGQQEFFSAPALKHQQPLTERPPALAHTFAYQLGQTSASLEERQHRQLSVLLFLSPSFISRKTSTWVNRCPS